MSNIIIFINGHINSGKDAAATHLSHTHSFSQYAFGDKIREGLYALDPAVVLPSINHLRLTRSLRSLVDDNGWDYCKRNIPEVRRLLQAYGTEAGKDIHGENTWSSLVFEQIIKEWEFGKEVKTVISDFRFAPEFEYFQDWVSFDWNLIILHITKPGVTNTETHISESLDVCAIFPEHVIELVNDGSIEELHLKIDELMTNLGVRLKESKSDK